MEFFLFFLQLSLSLELKEVKSSFLVLLVIKELVKLLKLLVISSFLSSSIILLSLIYFLSYFPLL